MGDGKNTLWRKGTLVDELTDGRRPWVFVFGLAVMILALDLILSVALSSSRDADPPLEGAADLRGLMDDARGEKGPSWILIGDSVVAGDVLKNEIPDWNRLKILDYLRSQKNPEFPDKFRQIGLNGLLPVDIERITQELDRRDPGGRVSLAIEINPRYFSRLYARQSAPTRGWMGGLAPPIVPAGGVASRWAWPRVQYRMAADWVTEHLPIYRHLSSLRNLPRIQPLLKLETLAERKSGTAKAAAGTDAAETRLAGFARVMEHYREPDLSNSSAQARALGRIVATAGVTRRRIAFFSTPLNDEFQAQAMDDHDYGEFISGLSRLIDRDPSGRVRLINLDHPLFQPQYFVDHCHLLPEGNRLLALNLLRELHIGLASVPRREELVQDTGPDRTLVWNIEPGHANGAGWQAKFNEPGGIAFDPVGKRIVIADTMNHCLRELTGDYQTVRLLAGESGVPGTGDGPALMARLNEPRDLLMIGPDVWFSDHQGGVLRRLRNGVIETIPPPGGGEAWSRLGTMRLHKGRIYLLDDERRILAFDPITGGVQAAGGTSGAEIIRTFDIADDGRIFAADSLGNIWVCPSLDDKLRVGIEDGTTRVWFASAGDLVTPRGVEFPMPFGKFALHRITDMRWFEAYGGLLVYNEEPVNPQPQFSMPIEQIEKMIAERVQIRLLREEDRKAYPWIKTHIYSSYFWANAHLGAETSEFRRGVMDLDEASGTLVQLERDRSRLLLYGDGIWAASKDGNGASGGNEQVWPGTEAAQQMSEKLRPDRLVPHRLERAPMAGPYVGLFIGSSMMSTSDMLSQYSGARAFETAMRELFEIRDGIRFDLIVRTVYGLQGKNIPGLVETYINSGIRPDFIFIDLFSDEHQNTWLISPMSPSGLQTDLLFKFLNDMEAAAAKYGSKLVFLDNSGMLSQNGEGLDPPQPMTRRVLDALEQSGHTVIRPTETLLRASQEISPWGGAPHYFKWHASPWAIQATAEVMARRAYPILREFVRGRTPAIYEPAYDPSAGVDPELMLGSAFQIPDLPLKELPRIQIPPGALHRSFSGGRISLFLDVAKIQEFDEQPEVVDKLVFSLLDQVLGGFNLEGRATSLELRLARFNNYDEYGQGVRDSATIIETREYNRESLEAFLRRIAPQPPTEELEN